MHLVLEITNVTGLTVVALQMIKLGGKTYRPIHTEGAAEASKDQNII